MDQKNDDATAGNDDTMVGKLLKSPSPQQLFYFSQFVCIVVFWLRYRLQSGKHLYEMVNISDVATRPSWMPTRVLLALLKLRVPATVLVPILMGLSSLCDARPLRLLTALVTSVYHCAETSITNRHGEYPMLYNVWAMLLPDAYAQAVSFGVAVNFVLSSGIAKLRVGGRAWMAPGTLKFYMDLFRNSHMPPLSKRLSGLIAARGWATSALSVATILLECGLVPGTLLMPGKFRQICGTGTMVGLHCGIAASMSSQVGAMFITSLPSYISGFACGAPVGSSPWGVAACIGLLPSLSALLGFPLPESWPSSPVALFMWNGPTASDIMTSLIAGDTRAVLASAAAPAAIEGLKVFPYGVAESVIVESLAGEGKEPAVLHDMLTRVVGLTMCQGSVQDAALTLRRDASKATGWHSATFIQQVQKWLVERRKLIEIHSGAEIVRAFFVRVKDGRAVLVADS